MTMRYQRLDVCVQLFLVRFATLPIFLWLCLWVCHRCRFNESRLLLKRQVKLLSYGS